MKRKTIILALCASAVAPALRKALLFALGTAIVAAMLIFAAGACHAQSSVLTDNSFGMQCGATNSLNCPDETWPTSLAQPGCFRLWDSQTQWATLNPSSGTYSWTNLDAWLVAIAAHQPRCVIYTIGWTPCNLTTGSCGSNGSASPPTDLAAGACGTGSCNFNNFITALVGHCANNGSGPCVSTYIKYFEMWNEANDPARWAGSIVQLYQMLAPAVATIKGAISGVQILGPPISMASGTSTCGSTAENWMTCWLQQEIAAGTVLENYYTIHNYLNDVTPEVRYSTVAAQLAPNTGTAGWSALPWWMSETNFDPSTFACQTSSYTANDCAGQIARWALLVLSNGAVNQSWYYYMDSIGDVAQYALAYYEMMQYLVGGTLTAACSSSSSTWSCPFTEANGTTALWVWSPCTLGGGYSSCAANGASYTVPAKYGDYRTLGGVTTAVTPGQNITIGVQPVMLEQGVSAMPAAGVRELLPGIR